MKVTLISCAMLFFLFNFAEKNSKSFLEEINALKEAGVKIQDFWEGENDVLFYIFPDIHATSVHKEHKKTIEILKKKFNLKLLGIEGRDPKPITSDTAKAEFLELKKNNFPCQLSVTEELLFGEKIKNLDSFDDFLRANPLFYYASPENGLELFGIDPYSAAVFNLRRMGEVKSLLNTLNQRFDRVKNLAEKYAGEKEKILQSLSELEKEYEKQKKIFLDELSISKKKFEEAVKQNSLERLEPITVEKLDILRSGKSVLILSQKAKADGLKKAALIFGKDHLFHITAACEKQGISYAIIDTPQYIKEAILKFTEKKQKK